MQSQCVEGLVKSEWGCGGGGVCAERNKMLLVFLVWIWISFKLVLK